MSETRANAGAVAGAGIRALPLDSIEISKTNPRKHFDGPALEDLTRSIRQKGILQPLLVRPFAPGAGGYQLVAGERRLRAARKAGLVQVPVIVRDLSDAEALEVQVIENLQRQDLHPLEEAEGYRQLMERGKHDAARVAERVGRSVRYVYDRVKLLSLTKAAQKVFLDGKISAAHAVLLARLAPKDQARAMEEHGALFTDERCLFTPEEEDELDGAHEDLKPRSVREFQGWIDAHVKLEHAEADPMLFPEMVAIVKAATEEAEKVVRITHAEITPDDARDGQKIVLGRSWRRADGKHRSKACERAVTGVIVIGPGRGEAFKVCLDKEKCAVHWGAEIKAKKKRQAAATKGGKTGEDRWAIEKRKREEQRVAQEREQARWLQAEPAIMKALAERVKGAPTRLDTPLGRLVMEFVGHQIDGAEGYLPAPKGADDLVRCLAMAALAEGLYSPEQLVKDANACFGLDVLKILNEIAPPATKEASCRKCGCTEAKACKVGGQGCSWVEKPNPKTGKGLCSACAPKPKAKAPAKRAKKVDRVAQHLE